MKRTLSVLLAVLLVLAAVPAFAEEGGLKAGLYSSESGTEILYLDEEGVGVLNYVPESLLTANGVVWTETTLEIERTEVPFELKDDVLSFTYEGTEFALRYSEPLVTFALGDQGTAFAGGYEAEDGKELILTADGKGTFDGLDIFWGSLLPYWNSAADENTCFILFDSYLGGLTFTEDGVLMDTDTGDQITFAPIVTPVDDVEAPTGNDAEIPSGNDAEVPAGNDAEAPAENEVEVPEPAVMTVISPAFDLSLSLPTDRWTVTETEAGLLIAQQRNLIQYTFLSMALEKEPSAGTLDAYADLVWKDALMGAGVAYDAAETVRGDHAVGEIAGRTAATEWTQDGATLLGDAVLWYANGRLYVALCASNETSRPEALAILNEALLTVRTAEEASQSLSIQLPVEKEVFDLIRELPPVAQVTEKVYYGYRVTSEGKTYDLVPILVLMGLDPTTFSLTLRSDGTGRLLLMEEADAMDFTWTEEAFLIDEEDIPYTREGDHILITIDEGSIEFAPAEEVEAALAELNGGETKDDAVTPTAEELIGTWTFTKARIMGIEISAADAGTEMSLVLNEDGSVIVLTDGSPAEYEWTIREDGKVAMNLADSEEYLLTYNGTELKLSVGVEGMEMIFEKAN